MRKLAALKILIWFLVANATSQTVDTSFISDCRILHDQGQLEEARACYLEHDTNVYALYGAAEISKQLNDSKSLKKLTKKLLSKKNSSPTSYELCAELYAEDSSRYIQILNKGLAQFVNDTLLLTHKINYYLNQGEFITSINLIDELILRKKEANKTLFFAKGYAYEMLDDNENAIKNYKKAIEIDSSFFDVYYNMAVVYYNQAVELYAVANYEMSTEEYSKLLAKAEDELAKALPYLEKANEIKPNDLMVLDVLKSIYYRLGYDELYDIEKQIKEIEND